MMLCQPPIPCLNLWIWFWKQLLPPTLHAARWALVLFDTFSFSWSDLHAFPMEPLLTDVAANPKLVCVIVPATAPTEGFAVFVFLLFVILICKLWIAFHQSITRSLHKRHPYEHQWHNNESILEQKSKFKNKTKKSSLIPSSKQTEINGNSMWFLMQPFFLQHFLGKSQFPIKTEETKAFFGLKI